MLYTQFKGWPVTDNSKIIKNLFYYLERHLFGADSDSGNELLDKGQFGVMMTPGQFLSPNWKENTGSADMYNQWAFLDEALDTSFVYRPLITTISGQYWDALDKVSLRHRPLTPAEKKELAEIIAEITALEPTYEVYQRRFEDADLAYEFEASKEHPDPARLRSLYTRRNQARNNWETLGQKSYFENDLQGRAWQIQTGNPSGTWLKHRNAFQNATAIAPQGEYQTTLLSPPISAWANAGWASFSKSISDTETHHYSKSTSWSGGFGVQWGLFNHVNVGANGEKTVVHDTSDVTTIDCSFEYLRCQIVRPWLKRDVFVNKDWTWKQPNTFKYLSDGGTLGATPPIRPLGTMPFLQTSIIAVRNVIIRADFSHTDRQEMTSRISGSVSAGWGPFSVRGSYSETTHSIDVRATFDGTELRIPHPQVIGLLGVLLPKSPDPDKSLPYWDPSAVFPDDSRSNDKKVRAEIAAYDSDLTRVGRAYAKASSAIDRKASQEKEVALRRIARLSNKPPKSYPGDGPPSRADRKARSRKKKK